MKNTSFIYLDNAATSGMKAPAVAEAIQSYFRETSVNINRSTYASASAAAMRVLECRELAAAMFGLDDPTHVIFTPGHTAGLNMVIKGYLREGDHVLTSSVEHNAVMRPLQQLAEEKHVVIDRVPCHEDGSLIAEEIIPFIHANTRLAIFTHASNVCGTVLPIAQIGEILEKYDIPLVLDGAQTAGHEPINFTAMHLSALSLPAHKGLLAAPGVGLLLLDPEFAANLTPLITGGTGSASDSEIQPSYMPDKFESGTLNLPGIFALHAALSFLTPERIEQLHVQESRLTQKFLKGIGENKHVRLAGCPTVSERVGVISIDCLTMDNAELAYRLETEYGICTRCGLHCAPSAHKTLGTFPQGTVRFSIGYGTQESDIDTALFALRKILSEE